MDGKTDTVRLYERMGFVLSEQVGSTRQILRLQR